MSSVYTTVTTTFNRRFHQVLQVAMATNTFILPPVGHMFVCEIDGRLRSMPEDHANALSFTNTVAKYPVASVSRELLHHYPMVSRESPQQLFLPTREPFSKRVISTWYQQGLRPALELLAEEGGGHSGKLLKYIFSIVDKIYGPKAANPSCASSAFNPIRLIAWHPHILALAVAAWDDSIRLFSTEESLSCILKTKMQRSVNCISWRPYTASTLAVGCEEGIIIWNRDPNNKTSMVCVTFLRPPNRAPVTSLAWDPQGGVLLTASSSNGEINVWNTEMEQCVRLPRKVRAGTSMVVWSPSKLHLLTASVTTAFYVWDRRDWSCERWTVSRGRVMSACFSPCGSVLLFTSSEEPLVFAISLRPTVNAIAGVAPSVQQAAQLVLDHGLQESEDGTRWGGLIKNMAWDPNGRYLAIISHETDLVTVFTTQLEDSLSIIHCCAINGKQGEKPSDICFQPDFQAGSLLTIAWSSGRVQYFPFVYTDMLPKVCPLQDVAPYLQMLSNPQVPTGKSVQPQSPYSPIFQSPMLSSPSQGLSTSVSYTQSPYASTSVQSPYTAQAQSPLSEQALSFQSYASPQNTTAQQSFQQTQTSFSALNASILKTP